MATRRVGPLRLPEPRYLGPLLVAWAVSLAVLFMERDLGSSLLFFGIFVAMLWVATSRGAFLGLGLALFVVGAIVGYLVFPHVQDRVQIWFHALQPSFVHDKGYQLAQSEFAFATGGIAGTGLGQGHPGLIPFAATDFIYAGFGEELGMFGATAILLLYVMMVARGFRVALSREDSFSKLLAAGLTFTARRCGPPWYRCSATLRYYPWTPQSSQSTAFSTRATTMTSLWLIRISAPAPAHARVRGRPAAAGQGTG